jgi:ABC-type glycerol-3-phosphate transport system permease component
VNEALAELRQAEAARHRRSFQARRRRYSAILYVLLAIACVVAVGPYIYLISTSLKKTTYLYTYPPRWFSWPPDLSNYQTLLTQYPFLRWALNTLIVAGAVTAIKVMIDSLAGYAFARLRFPGKEIIFIIMLASMMIPFAAMLIPLYLMVRSLGIQNTYWALILPPLASPIGIFMMRQFVEGLPAELTSAARVDRCSEFGVYWHIMLPLMRPGLVVLGIYTFMTQWTSFLWPLVITTSNDMMVLTVGVQSIKTIYTVDWGLISAGSVLMMIPITVVFILLQRYFIAASIAGAIKT